MPEIPREIMQMLKGMQNDGLDNKMIHKQITECLHEYIQSPENLHKDKLAPTTLTDGEATFFVPKSINNWMLTGVAAAESINLLKVYYRIVGPKSRSHKFDEEMLVGTYNVYFSNLYDTGESNVMRAPLFMEKRDDHNPENKVYNVVFKDLRVVYEGIATVVNGLINFDLRAAQKFIYFTVALPKAGSFSDHGSFILDAKSIVNEESRQYFRSLIIVKDSSNPYERKSEFLDRPILPCVFSETSNKEINDVVDNTNNLTDGLSDEERNHIMIYLSRKESKNFMLSQFNSYTFKSLKESNDKYDKKEGVNRYYQIKNLLNQQEKGYKYYSFNRSKPDSSQVSIFFYQFSFSDAERVCRVVRRRIEEPETDEFNGEVLLDNNRLYFALTDHDRDNVRRRKLVISDYEPRSSSQYFILKAITASVIQKTNEAMGLRELIAYLPESELRLTKDEMKAGCISYSRFCELNDTLIMRVDRGYLANRSLCIISYPQRNSIHMREGMSQFYSGVYHIYLLNGYDSNSKTLLKLILKIDELAQVTILIKYEGSAEEHIYRGDCQYFGVNLSIQAFLESEFAKKQRMATMIFDQLPSAQESIYTGITIDTDLSQNAVSYSFLAIRNHFLANNGISVKTEPEIITKDDFNQNIIKELTNLPHIKANAEKVIQSVEKDNFFWKGTNH